MIAKINVLFEMSFDDQTGECKQLVSWKFPDYPEMTVPEEMKLMVVPEIG